MTKIYSYVLPYDCGAAPNPLWGICTLTICKPVIRSNASLNDWVIGTGSVNAECSKSKYQDFSGKLIYAMKITDIKSLQQYDEFCKISLPNKIPNWQSTDWQFRMGDCIYDYSDNIEHPAQRGGFHNEGNREVDLKGKKALLSNHFYYFGDDAQTIPDDLKEIIKQKQGHRKIENEALVKRFEEWMLSKFQLNKIYGDPQMRWQFDNQTENEIATACSVCAERHLNDDIDITEERYC